MGFDRKKPVSTTSAATMNGFLPDTNHVSKAVWRNSPLLERIQEEKRKGIRIGTCIPVLCEIETGRLQVARPDVYTAGLSKLLRQITLWPLTRKTAANFGQIKLDLRRRGRAL